VRIWNYKSVPLSAAISQIWFLYILGNTETRC
jgi:hypothetical protein